MILPRSCSVSPDRGEIMLVISGGRFTLESTCLHLMGSVVVRLICMVFSGDLFSWRKCCGRAAADRDGRPARLLTASCLICEYVIELRSFLRDAASSPVVSGTNTEPNAKR